MIETLPSPYYAVIFTSVRTATGAEEYERASQRMLELVQAQPGFLGVKSVRGEDGLGITVSCWTDQAAILAWKNHPEHQEIRERGRRIWYRSYHIRITRVERSYSA
ncbi:antibiotic biosynthesis monooxygenase [Pseudomonas sp. LP_7_YM]|uniref:antibiotic biosynthesis monooxygenase family protein n=1 Tax=Pseudomonas sp. LP_7_YM TaxID=2485137 RepID=UPI00105D34D5|nr:antibiotic biosynthesis monooxygenase [Pseudomonas sp. LP_7_YM]TDV63470.1 heme-degrading monooxygenase HmoA [Pseudomonas sp. LP_7_YM]